VVGYRGASCSAESAIQTSLWKANAHKAVGTALQHQLSTFEGNSGSPLLVRRGGRHMAIAIHKGAPTKAQFNCGRLITRELMVTLLTWEKEMASEIRFSVMKNSVDSVADDQSQQWLASVNWEIKVLMDRLLDTSSKSSVFSTLKKVPPPR
jgi:hypothetical protein